MGHLLRYSCVVVACLYAFPGWAEPPQDAGQRVVHLLAYVQVDYAGAVADGAIISAEEYAEMQEFAATVHELIGALPKPATQHGLTAQAATLLQAIAARAPASDVAAQAGALKDAVITAYGVVVTPRQAPDLALGAVLYQDNCASCHGVAGQGDGAAGKTLEPPPSNFTDVARHRQQTLYGYYNTITLGVGGTGMRAFAELSDADRWALAFHVGTLLHDDAERARGAKLWADKAYAALFPGLGALTRAAPAALGSAQAEAVLAYLRAAPQALAPAGGPLEVARRRLADSVSAYRAGDREESYRAALSAYLDGFELLEQSLAATDNALKLRIEARMFAFRTRIKSAAPVEELVAAQGELLADFDAAAMRVGRGTLDPLLGFFSALIILLREGLEAVLVLAAIMAFLVRAGRADSVRYVHYGWISALAAGFVTAAIAAWVVNISGAVRELSEGLSALVAAVVLFYMGYWLHDKSHAQRWQAYISQRLAGVLDGKALGALVAVSFIAVYREMFETILFYQALWMQTAAGGQAYLVAGVGVGAALLVGSAYALLRLSARLPLGLFFGASALLMYLLAVVFAGKGVMALQEAGKLPIWDVNFPRVDLLGIYPSALALALQGTMLAVAIGQLWWMTRRRSRREAPPSILI